MANKKLIEDKLNLESILFNCRDYLPGNAALMDKRDMLLTLVFLRFIGEKFKNVQNAMRQECMDRGYDDTIAQAFLDSPQRYPVGSYVPEKVRWTYIAQQPANKLNVILDDALDAIENSGDALKGCVRLGLFSQINLEANVIKKVVDKISKISHKTFG